MTSSARPTTPRTSAGSASTTTSTPHRRADSTWSRTTPVTRASPPRTSTRTAHPQVARCRAATSPSPPLLPYPATTLTAAGPPSRCHAHRATCHPATSMSWSVVTPRSAAAASSRATSSEVRSPRASGVSGLVVTPARPRLGRRGADLRPPRRRRRGRRPRGDRRCRSAHPGPRRCAHRWSPGRLLPPPGQVTDRTDAPARSAARMVVIALPKWSTTATRPVTRLPTRSGERVCEDDRIVDEIAAATSNRSLEESSAAKGANTSRP